MQSENTAQLEREGEGERGRGAEGGGQGEEEEDERGGGKGGRLMITWLSCPYRAVSQDQGKDDYNRLHHEQPSAGVGGVSSYTSGSALASVRPSVLGCHFSVKSVIHGGDG